MASGVLDLAEQNKEDRLKIAGEFLITCLNLQSAGLK
jgi:hypothetical protein